MDLKGAHTVLRAQDGVISRTQALECGLDDNDLERLLRRRELARIHPGVYVDHTGQPTWTQRAWAGVLFHWPAALAGASALRVHGLRSAAGEVTAAPWLDREMSLGRVALEPVHVVIDARRRVASPTGVFVTRRTDFERRVQLHLSPPRLRLDEALLDVASACTDEATAVAVLADACQQRVTTAARLHDALSARGRLPRRGLLLPILDDVAAGTMSVFERRYLHGVERSHGLPTARRQVKVVTRRGVTYRDVEYSDFAVVVELDGRFAHAGPRREWADLERDVDAVARGESTLRLGWSHVLEPCRASLLVGRLLQSRGWDGEPSSCGRDCRAARGRRAA
ncbi:MAG: type IV toxin-antitoxin system AbiEi family antitoxin domain-containing protein [Terrabacter sp.]|nr:type IV toxin-antitoxin system AbiEi family antitoxin domain-containing protein [Terrabacter sp.]